MRHHNKRGESLHKLALLGGILAVYTIYLIFEFGSDGLLLGALTWSAFVLATPIADAGLLLDLPVRYITGLPMVLSEIAVWGIAIGLNIVIFLTGNQAVYQNTRITAAFGKILAHPWPNWIIIGLSAAGTFGSLWVADRIYSSVGSGRWRSLFQHAGWQLGITALGFVALYYVYRAFLGLFGIDL